MRASRTDRCAGGFATCKAARAGAARREADGDGWGRGAGGVAVVLGAVVLNGAACRAALPCPGACADAAAGFPGVPGEVSCAELAEGGFRAGWACLAAGGARLERPEAPAPAAVPRVNV